MSGLRSVAGIPMRARVRQIVRGLAVSLAGLLVVAQPAGACSVCFGAPDSPMTEGLNAAIMFLVSTVGVVQLGFVALFVSIRRRAKRLEQQKSRLQLIEGGAG